MEDSNRARIVQAAHELFNTRGYKSVTISDLAERLGMSKKTIYQSFSGKEEIAATVIQNTLSRVNAVISNAELQQSDPLELLQATLQNIRNQLISMGPLFMADVQKYLPELWQRIVEFRAEQLTFVERLLRRAQEEGLVKDIEPRLAMIIFLEAATALTKLDAMAKHGVSLVEASDALIQIFCTGVVKSGQHS